MSTLKSIIMAVLGVSFLALPSYAGDGVVYYGKKGTYVVSHSGDYQGCVERNGCLDLSFDKIVQENENTTVWKNGAYYYIVARDCCVTVVKNGVEIFRDNFTRSETY